MALRFLCAMLFCGLPALAVGQQLAMYSDWTGARSLFDAPGSGAELERRQAASLFAGRTGLFAAPVRRAPAAAARAPAPRHGPQIALLRDLIAAAEAGPMGYDAVQHGARVRPGRPPTTMTLAEIFAWIEATPGQPHAIGRYQFIPATLAYLVQDLGIPETARFVPGLQDRLADRLLEQAGLAEFQAGLTSRHAFMNAIAKIWAGLPNSTGRSHYHGVAGNKAVVSWAHFDAEMARIFPG